MAPTGSRWRGRRLAAAERHSARAFDDWGLPTGVLLAALGADDAGRVIASGGLRHGVHLAKAVALGAGLGAMALPFIRAVMAGGTDGVLALIARIEHELRVAMTLCGAPTLAALRRAPVMQSAAFRHQVAELSRVASADGGTNTVGCPERVAGGTALTPVSVRLFTGPCEACGDGLSVGGRREWLSWHSGTAPTRIRTAPGWRPPARCRSRCSAVRPAISTSSMR